MALHLLVWLGSEPTRAIRGLALALTYAAHALLWAVAVACVMRRQSLASAAQQLLWKLALFAPILSTSIAVGAPWVQARVFHDSPPVRELPVLSLPFASAEQRAPFSVQNAHVPFVSVLVTCGVVGSALGLLRFAIAALLLWGRLRDRVPVRDLDLLKRLERIRARTALGRVRLTESTHIAGPLALTATEICLPRGLLTGFCEAEVESVFAHELAHLERRDWFWFPAVGFLESLLWLQPLNHWVANRVRRSAELACDDRAVALTGDPGGLARALVRVAALTVFAGERALLLPAMARSRGALVIRVTRLSASGPASGFATSARPRRWALASLVGVAALTASLSVQVARARTVAAPLGITPNPTRKLGARLSTGARRPPDAERVSRRMIELSEQEQMLAGQIERLVVESQPELALTGVPDRVHVLELRQELEHVRASRSWIEQRFVEDSAAWESR